MLVVIFLNIVFQVIYSLFTFSTEEFRGSWGCVISYGQQGIRKQDHFHPVTVTLVLHSHRVSLSDCKSWDVPCLAPTQVFVWLEWLGSGNWCKLKVTFFLGWLISFNLKVFPDVICYKDLRMLVQEMMSMWEWERAISLGTRYDYLFQNSGHLMAQVPALHLDAWLWCASVSR